ncbi:Fc.00g061280.m01.CDS01 [Cosmosporella sp. VM-42]
MKHANRQCSPSICRQKTQDSVQYVLLSARYSSRGYQESSAHRAAFNIVFPHSFMIALVVIAGIHNVRNQDNSRIRDFGAEQLNRAMKEPNAAEEYSILDTSGFDLTKEWPGTPAAGWKAHIEIKANVEVSNNRYTTVTRISSVPPDNVEVMSNDIAEFAPMDRTWYPCSQFQVSDQLTASTDNIDATSCGSLADNCTNDIL